MERANRRFAALMMAPAAAFLAIFVGWPIFSFVKNSFYRVSPVAGGPSEFIGLDNYVQLMSDSAFSDSAWRTAAYTLIVVFFEFVLGFIVAMLFTTLGSRSTIFRTLFMYPLMIAPIVAGLLWRYLLIDNFGIVNELLVRVGILSSAHDVQWLSDPKIALLAVAFPDIWLTTSFIALVIFAGLQNLPGEVIEAARIDGAGFWTILFRIVIPLLRPVIAVALVIRGIDAARAFDIIQIQTGGGPQDSTNVMSLLIYRTMVRFGDPGMASAMGTIYLIVMLLIATFAVKWIWQPGEDRS